MDKNARAYIDAETGQVYDLVAVPRAERTYTPGGWIMAMQHGLAALATDHTLTDGDMRVINALLGRLDWDNYIHLEVSELATDLGRSREAVSRSISRLIKRGVLHRGPRVGRAFTYRLDPAYGYKGQAKNRAALAAELDRKGWSVIDGGNDRQDAADGASGAVPGQDAFDL